jgi:hypothetical protein|tara:strand:- start:6561 stop:6836 length:276 start_codon:yes stop_codon:yes gene_type:complete
MERITNKHIDHQVQILNSCFGIENAEWNTVGRFYVEGANGGFRLVRVVSESGAETDISKRGTKREVYEQLRVLNEGLRLFQTEFRMFGLAS